MRKSTKYLSYDTAKQYVGKLGFKSLLEYRNYISTHNINFLPEKPDAHYYAKGYSTPEFLGIEVETYKVHMREFRKSQCAMMRTFVTPESQAKRVKSRASKAKSATKLSVGRLKSSQPTIVTTINGLDPEMVIQFLIDKNVEPETIVDFIAMMDINSGTLISELCKYMAKKNFEKQQTWRPTGYNTSEAQISLKI